MTTNDVSSIRVLYVEDTKSVQAVVSQMLELLGYQVRCADNGQIGLEMAESWQPHIILMDIRMPVMDGIEATRHIRRNPTTAHIPVVMVSAYTDAKSRDMCRQAGANDFIPKPISLIKINATIQKLLKI